MFKMLNTKNNLKHRIMAIRFAIWDIHLYLDTHCPDSMAQDLLKKYEEQYMALIDEYESLYGCISIGGCDCENWLSKPFPWDNSGSGC